MSPHHHHSCCTCHRSHQVTACFPTLNRRQFLYHVGSFAAGSLAMSAFDLAAAEAGSGPPRHPRYCKPLRVQPVLTYETPQRKEHTSWRNWGGIQTENDAAREKTHIDSELTALKTKADFPLEFLPIISARSGDEAAATLEHTDFDTLLLYAAGGWGLEKLLRKEHFNLMFLRHDPGPVYLWYEIVHPRLLRKTVDEYGQPEIDVHDVVVDQSEELLWRLRAQAALKNTLGKRIVCIGGPAGWGEGGHRAPAIARQTWKLELVDYPYPELEKRLKAAFQDPALLRRSEAAAGRLLHEPRLSLQTARPFLNNAFVLTEVFKDILDEAGTDAITVNQCMGTIMGMSQTTACMPLSLLNDEAYLAFCESDFVVIPSGILLHYISSRPVFLNDPTFPHDDVVTLAHCTAPRKMDGHRPERTKILTHFESDYGAAPKVEMKIGQLTTTLVPDFACKRWLGFAGTIVGNPFLDICRSQVDVRVHGDANALLEQMKGFHWMLCYGDYLKESSYALKKLGVEFVNVSTLPKAT